MVFSSKIEHKWQNPEERLKILARTISLCKAKNVKLLYLVIFGSALYGTDTPESDIDVKGLFAPNLDTLLLGEDQRSIHETTGDPSEKNSAADVDIDLWSIRYWLLDLLKKGETGAVDLLFSHTHEACVLYKARCMDWIFQNANRLINSSLAEAAAKYAVGQAKKYGIKGSRLGMFKRLKKTLEKFDDVGRLREIIPTLVQEFETDPFFSHKEGCIVTGGKTHVDSIKIGEFKKRIDAEVATYGSRAEDALNNSGMDFKALSHALRAIGQMEELLTSGKIVYPLAFRNELIKVKSAKISWPKVEAMILAGINNLESLKDQANNLAWDEKFARGCALRIGKGEIPVEYAIQELLDEVEARENVKILMAVESGSRAWGMESDDSDYDVRFVYTHSPDWYLDSCVRPRKDTINVLARNTETGVIDAEGWDITKALALFARSNPSIIEWLSSPVRYRYSQPFMDLMISNMRYASRIVALYHHYWKMGKNGWERFQVSGTLKPLCYSMRGMLMALFVKHSPKFSQPLPMDIKRVIDKVIQYLPDNLEGKNDLAPDIEETINLKRHSEQATGAATKSMLAFMRYMLQDNQPDVLTFRMDAAFERKEIDLPQLFKAVLKNTWQ